MARTLDLRTGRPVWHAYRAPAVPFSKLTRDVKADVLVVGMGISGAMTAEALTAAGLSVIVVDRRGPMLGSTAATTALVQFEIDTPLTRLAKMIGRAKAERAWRRSRLAVVNLGAHVRELGIACNLAPRSSLYLAGTMLGPADLRDEGAARRAAGLSSIYVTAAELKDRFGMVRDGALMSHDNLAIDPRKLTAGLFLKALQRKARFYAPVEVAAFEDNREGVTASTLDGPLIAAGHVILATGYELAAIVPAAKHSVISTWAIATNPQKTNLWPGPAFIWEASEPYLYMRATSDGRVICGGEDEEFTDEERRDALLPAKTKAIAAKLKKLFPTLDAEPDFAWTGAFGTTTTGLPVIAAVPRHARLHAIMGYGGNGITFSRIAAEMITTTLTGGEDSDRDLFAFG